MQLWNSLGPSLVRTQVFEPVWPAGSPPGPHEHDGSSRNLSVLLFPSGDIRWLKPVIGRRCRLGRHVDHHRGTDQLIQGNLVGGMMSRREMDRGIEMSTAMLRGREVVRCVVVAAWGYFVGYHFQGEGLRGGPIDRLTGEIPAQVHPASSRKSVRGRPGLTGEDPQSENREAENRRAHGISCRREGGSRLPRYDALHKRTHPNRPRVGRATG